MSFGAEIGCHKKDHKYQISQDSTNTAFDIHNPWSLAEETMLLDAVEQYGFGNWEDVSNHVESRTPEECEEHYVTFYIKGNIGRVSFTSGSFGHVSDHTCPDGGPLSPSITTPINPLELSIQEQHELGYMPFRDDFEREYDNEAETLVSSLAIDYDDEDIDIAFKLTQIEKYRSRLKERERRKKIAREYGLITAAAQAAVAAASTPGKTPKSIFNKKKLSKEDREFQEKLKPFAHFLPSAEFEPYFESLQKEKELKARIKELMKFRKKGITSLSEIEDFEDEKLKRDKKKENRKKLGSLAQMKRNSMASKKAAEEEKLDILIDDGDLKDEDGSVPSTQDMVSLPGYEMLSERERRLCSSIGMSPANYITIKTCIIKDYLQRRQGLPVKIRYPSGMDKTHRRKIMSFLTDNGWIGVT
ncbi:hypothetical protein ACJMK2_037393 [Sinanodonta woodiana]|uniref:Transcriptional adapter n=1 Tax=Sinanodonta woodiana TaxID=1069815 RepID=A0ABD3WK63_SINWO